MKKNDFWKRLFAVRQCNEKGTQWAICIGNHRAVEQFFDSREEAEEFAKVPSWELICAVCVCVNEMVMNNQSKEEEDKK